MSARDDYPSGAGTPTHQRMCDEIDKLRALHQYISELRVEGSGDVLHMTDETHYNHRTSYASNLLAVLRGLAGLQHTPLARVLPSHEGEIRNDHS